MNPLACSITAGIVLMTTPAVFGVPIISDGKYTTFNKNESNLPIVVVVRGGKVAYANWRPVMGCNAGDRSDSRSCDRVLKQLKQINKCSLRWSIHWEGDYHKQVLLRKEAC